MEQSLEGPEVEQVAADLAYWIDRQLTADEKTPEKDSLVGVLRKAHDSLLSVHDTASLSQAQSLLSLLGQLIDEFDCEKCGQPGMVCNGTIDPDLFDAHDGGRCLSFVRGLVQVFAEFTLQRYATLTKGLVSSNGFPEIRVQTVPWQRQGTLPIDGELVPAPQPVSKSSPVILRILWPRSLAGRALEDALASLPYLIFHELFVHALQGMSTEEPGFVVQNDCSFTEGTMDSLACELLLDEILPSIGRFVPRLGVLKEAFIQATADYHRARFHLDEPGSESDHLDPTQQIRRARHFGRLRYRYLRELQKWHCKPKDWTASLLTLLNLQLTPEKRDDFLQMLVLTQSFGKSGTFDLVKALDEYLVTKDVEALLARLNQIVDH
jgi:hypothetical protein